MDFFKLQNRLSEIDQSNITNEQKNALGMEALSQAGLTYDEYITLMDDNEEMAAELMEDPVNWMIGAARSVGNGILLGHAPQLEALIESSITRKGYDETLLDVQAGLKAFQNANPGTSLAFEVGGSFFTPYAGFTLNMLRKGYGVYRTGKAIQTAKQAGLQVPRFLRGKQLGQEIAAQGTMGTGMGAIYAMGTGADVEEGAIYGGAGGAGLTGVLKGVGAVGRKAGILKGDGYIPPKKPPEGDVPSVTGEPPGPMNQGKLFADRQAIAMLTKRALDEGKDFDEMLMEVDEYTKLGLGDEVTLMDLGAPLGDIRRQASGDILNQFNVSRTAMQQLDERGYQAAERTIEFLQNKLFPKNLDGIPGPLPKDTWELTTLISQQRKQNADELYTLARGVDKENVIEAPEFYLAIKQLHNDSKVFRDIWKNYNDSTSLRGRGLNPGDKMTIKQFDEFKRFGLDQTANVETQNQGRKALAGEIKELKNELMGYVFKNPNGGSEYKLAVETFAGDSAVKDVYDLGKKILKDKDYTPGRIRHLVKQLGPDERTYLKLGMVQSMIDNLMFAGDNIRNVNVKPKVTGANPKSMIRSKLAAVLGDEPEKLDQIVGRMDREGEFISSFKELLGGSPTARNLVSSQSAKEVSDELVKTGMDIASGNNLSMVGRAWDATKSIIPGTQASQSRQERWYGDQVANRMFNKGEGSLRDTIERMKQYRTTLQKSIDKMPRSQPFQTEIWDYYNQGLLE